MSVDAFFNSVNFAGNWIPTIDSPYKRRELPRHGIEAIPFFFHENCNDGLSVFAERMGGSDIVVHKDISVN